MIPGPELDIWLAENLMGWKALGKHPDIFWNATAHRTHLVLGGPAEVARREKGIYDDPDSSFVWNPSTSDALAFAEIIPAMVKQGYDWEVGGSILFDNQVSASFWKSETPEVSWEMTHDTVTGAVALAAKAALENEK